MQDGSPPHCSITARNWLNEKLPNGWIGTGANTDLNINWPPRFPDLTPCDFFLWRYIKCKVYNSQPNNINELKTKIQNALGDVTLEMLNNSIRSFQNRLNLVIQ